MISNKKALAYAKHELEYYKQVERDGIRMSQQIEFYKRVVAALKKQTPQETPTHDKTVCPSCNSKAIYGKPYEYYCCHCGQRLKIGAWQE